MRYLLYALFLSYLGVAEAQKMGSEDLSISIYFGGGSYMIDRQQELMLTDFINGVDDLDIYQIEVHGHTDNIGSLSFNHYLSQKRSEMVISLLQALSIDPRRIIQYDHGELNPHYDNNDWNGKLHNRRVDVILRRLAS